MFRSGCCDDLHALRPAGGLGMNLGIVTPQLNHYGGSEVYLLECLRRWQEAVDITLYTPFLRRDLLDEFEIASRVKVVKLPRGRTGPDAFFYNTVVLPRLWEQVIGPHDLYFLYLFPTHFIQRRPSVWFAAEPLRTLYDLRQEHDGGAELVLVQDLEVLDAGAREIPSDEALLDEVVELRLRDLVEHVAHRGSERACIFRERNKRPQNVLDGFEFVIVSHDHRSPYLRGDDALVEALRLSIAS